MAWLMVAIKPSPISLAITSLALIPIFFASSPTAMASATRIRLLIAFGTVISVFFIFGTVAFLSSFHLADRSSRSNVSNLPFLSKTFFISIFLRTASLSPMSTSTGAFAPFLFGFSTSLRAGGPSFDEMRSLTILSSGLFGTSFLSSARLSFIS